MAVRALATGARALLVVLAAAAGCAQGMPGDAAATQSVVHLAASLSPRARPERDLGRMDPGVRLENMSMLLAPSGSKLEREAFIASLQDPTSPQYHRWLTPEQVADRFGARPADIERVIAWLRERGFDVTGTARTGLRVFFSGTVDRVERAFATEMHRYAIGGQTHFAMGLAPTIPADLAHVVVGLHGTDDLRPDPPRRTRVAPDFRQQGSSTYELSPPDFAVIYDVSPLYATGIDGTGQKIAIAGQTSIYAADVAAFRSTFGLPDVQPTDLLVPMSGNAYVSANDLVEAEIDVEWSGAVARNADIVFVHTGDNQTYSVFDSVYYAIEEDIAPVVSLSYGYCEYQATPSDAIFYETMGDVATMLGISLVTSSGDDGPATCDYGGMQGTFGLSVDFPADLPTVTGVGGTDIIAQPASTYFGANGYALSYIPEVGWNDTSASVRSGGAMAASGGGASKVFPKPYWQMAVTTPSDGARDVPDVALSASSLAVPYVIVSTGHLVQVGGTSVAAPSFAAMLALVNQAIGAPQPGLGNVNPILYALSQSAPDAFHDITQGDNLVPCEAGTPDCPSAAPYEYGYHCLTGYDQVTGLGSVDAAKLVQAWQSLVPTSTTLAALPQGTTEGSPLELDATIASNDTSTTMSGYVTFYYYTQYGGGGIDLSAPLGTVAVTPVTTPTEGATASLMTHAPPGLVGEAQVVAFYGGDSHYLASWSALTPVSATSTLAITPASPTVNPGQTVHFAATGGQSPFVWTWGTTTITSTSSIDVDTGVYVASSTGPEQDSILVVDAYGAEAFATVNILPSGPTDGGTTEDGGARSDAGSLDAGSDTRPPPADSSTDTGSQDSGAKPPPPSGSPGCSCTAAGARGSSESPAAWLAAALVACATGRARKKCRTSSRATRPAPRRGS